MSKREGPSLKFLIGVFAVTLVIAFVVIFVVLNTLINRSEPRVYTYTDEEASGVRVIDPPRELADFSMLTHTGSDMSLSDFQGQNILLYFGYTHCPDVCLISLSEVIKVRDGLGAAGDDMAYIFISVDGTRDTPERLVEFFEPRYVAEFMVGMSGDEDTLAQIGPDYGLYYQLNDDADQNGNYSVDHTANLYFINPDRQLTTIYAYGTDTDLIIESIREQLP